MQAFDQLNYYMQDRGLNFIDTAEVYPVPVEQQHQGATERIIGNYIAKHAAMREKMVLATKVGTICRSV